MPLLHLAYSSRTRDSAATDEILREIERFRRRNLEIGITGCIAFEGGRIMQILEGPDREVEAMFTAIAADRRHHGIVDLTRKPIAAANFRHWGMVRRPIGDVVFLSKLC